jgi:hypothetical protein
MDVKDSVAKKMAGELLKAALARHEGAPGEVVHADLGGNVLDPEAYRKRLEEDSAFQEEELGRVVASVNVSAAKPGELTPFEVRRIASRVAQLIGDNPKFDRHAAWEKFLSGRPELKNIDPADLEQIGKTLRFEHGLPGVIPTRLKASSISGAHRPGPGRGTPGGAGSSGAAG